MRKIKLISFFAILSTVFGWTMMAQAASPYLYISPSSGEKNIGDTFGVSVGVSQSESKVYAVEGTLSFNNLSCQSISVSSGLMTQVTPTCASPYFLVGIPSGSVDGKVLLTITVKTGNSGSASISASSVDIIGDGKSLSTASSAASYTVKSNTVETKPTITTEPTITLDVVNTNATPSTKITKANDNESVVETDEVTTSTVTTSEDVTESEETGSVLGATEEASALKMSSGKIALWAIIILIILVVLYIIAKKFFGKKSV